MKTLRRHGGFGLVEIMVGLVIGLVAMLVITQVMSMFEGQKRTSTGGSDAQVNGGVALFTMEREIRMAGYGITGPNGLLCPLGINIYYNGSTVSNGGSLAPIIIIDGGTGPDTVATVRSDADFGAIPTSIIKQMPTPSAEITADGTGGLKQSQMFLVTASDGSKVCTLMEMSQDPQKTGNGWNLQHNSGQYLYNPPNPANAFTNAPQYSIGDSVVNMGSFMNRRYQVLCDQLTEVNTTVVAAPYTCANTTPLVAQIVNMQAQYGVAPTGSQTVNEWKNPTGIWAWDPAAGTPSAVNIARVKAVRIAIVARSPQYEKEMVSPASLTLWTADAGADAAPVMALTDEQRHYRYKVFETIVPVRNVIWAGI